MGQEDREILTIRRKWSSGCEGTDDLDACLLEIGAVAGGDNSKPHDLTRHEVVLNPRSYPLLGRRRA